MSAYDILEAQSNLPHLIDAVQSGREQEIVIARDGEPAVRIVPLAPQRKPIRLGLAKGLFEVPDDIDGANPIIERMFNGDFD